jgi:hypothetical protein
MEAGGEAVRQKGRNRAKRALFAMLALAAAYALLAYVVLPAAWTHHEHQPGLAGRPMVTRTAEGIPGDPLNIGLVGGQNDVVRAMHAAGWFPADPITLRSSAAIVASVLLDRPYRTAPVSPLYYDGRREDLAYELPAGGSASRRHHVRFWKVMDAGAEGRPVWLGSATFDRGVAVSTYTGQVTHAIAPVIDAERDYLAESLETAGMVMTIYQVTGIGPTLAGRNGEGTRYHTDGEVRMLVLVEDGRRRTAPPTVIEASPLVLAKDAGWRAIKGAVGG